MQRPFINLILVLCTITGTVFAGQGSVKELIQKFAEADNSQKASLFEKILEHHQQWKKRHGHRDLIDEPPVGND